MALEDSQQVRMPDPAAFPAQDWDRRRIAEEVHDRIIQPLIFLDVRVKLLEGAASEAELTQSCGEIRKVLSTLIEQARALTYDFGDILPQHIRLKDAITEYLRLEIKAKHNTQTRFTYELKDGAIDQDVATYIYKSVKELLVNVVKHARAANVNVSIVQRDENVVVCVEDDGRGFDAGARTEEHSGKAFGLSNIREKANNFGGYLGIESQAGMGARVTLTVPLKAAYSLTGKL